MIGVFGVRRDKNHGLMIETLAANDDEYFFKPHDQPLYRHCEQVQNIIKTANVIRTKKITVDMSAFWYEYFTWDNTALFKRSKLNSVKQQKEKCHTMQLNKELGNEKRKATVVANKQAKIEEKATKIATMIEEAKIKFEQERERRLIQIFGKPQAPTSPPKATPKAAPTVMKVMPMNRGHGSSDGHDGSQAQFGHSSGQGLAPGGAQAQFGHSSGQGLAPGNPGGNQGLFGHFNGHVLARGGAQNQDPTEESLDIPDLPEYDSEFDSDTEMT